jgi:NaMN:DMB phosphoribosyltransferase
MEIRDQDHYRELFDKLFGKFLTDKTSIEDVKFSLMDGTFKACYEMLIREAITPYDAMVIMTKQNIEMQKKLTELIMMSPQPIRFKDEYPVR